MVSPHSAMSVATRSPVTKSSSRTSRTTTSAAAAPLPCVTRSLKLARAIARPRQRQAAHILDAILDAHRREANTGREKAARRGGPPGAARDTSRAHLCYRHWFGAAAGGVAGAGGAV
ncbi:hypothetical protein GCM10008026_30240 [Chelatococcus composti]|nr:hypothetical protein GCM10008026_30240 [Chelatococcus composti]